MSYDPNRAPEPVTWLSLDEAERLDGVLRYHQQVRFRADNVRLHAAVHVTVENQLAEGHAGATRALDRLLAEGLDRHEAIHAIGAVATEQIYHALKGRPFDAAEYDRRLAALDAVSWRRSGKPPEQ
jgi:hypothetical protein